MKCTKIPVNQRLFGIEVELSTPIDDVQKHLINFFSDEEFKVYQASQPTTKQYFELKLDGTTECEIATPKMTTKSESWSSFILMLKLLKRRKIMVTSNDGVHVHVNCKHVNKRSIFNHWIYFENVFRTLFPLDRTCRHTDDKLNSHFSYPFVENLNDKSYVKDIIKEKYNDAMSHHSAMSMHWWDRRKTVEFRFHEGSLEIDSIVPWSLLCIRFINRCGLTLTNEFNNKRVNEATVQDFLKWLNIRDKYITNWIKRRHELFK